MFDLRLICDACADALRERARALDEEQSPYGIDALSELDLHPILHAGCRNAGYTVLREQRYPTHASRPRRSEGDRCDIVLTERPGEALFDPSMAGTLFAERGVAAQDALWVEVKVAAQFALVGGVACANQAYSALLLRGAAADVRKLASDERIRHAAVLLVMFGERESLLRHDVDAWACACIDNGLEIGAPLVSACAITDRIGNRACAVALTSVSPAMKPA